MGYFASRTRKNYGGARKLHQGKSVAASSGAFLDQMTITCDKVKTINTLRIAETMFLKNAMLIRQNNGPEQMAKRWEEEAGVIAYMINQIGNNGGQITKGK